MATAVSLPLNETCTITASPVDAGGSVVTIAAPPTWTSGTPAIATVAPTPTLTLHVFQAVVTPLAVGTTVITIASGALTALVDVTVVAAVVDIPTGFIVNTVVQ